MVVAPVGLMACGSDDDPDADREASNIDTYCDAIARYDELTKSVDVSSISGMRQGMEEAVEALRDAAEAAPQEVADEVAALVAGGEALVGVARTTEGDDLQVWLEELSNASADLESEFGDLEAETAAMQTHASSVCGLEIG
ncbi:MAG TPA: hypothetical protein VIR30_15395 [Nocardioides sp.]